MVKDCLACRHPDRDHLEQSLVGGEPEGIRAHARNQKGGDSMDLMKYIERMHEFREREGYYPAFGETQRREQGDWKPEPEPEQPTRPRFMPRSSRRPWK